MQADGRYDLIESALHGPNVDSLYGTKNELLLHLDRGAAALALGEPETAFYEWEIAERIMEERRRPNAGQRLGVLIVNDNAAPYAGEAYEDQYVNVFKMLAHLDSGWIQGGATVEARRLAIKANLLRDEHLSLAEATREESDVDEEQLGEALSDVIRYDAGGQFVESPLGVYLSAITYMHSGEPENQRVAARRLQEITTSQRALIGDVDAAAFEGLAERRPSESNVLLVAFTGSGPSKRAARMPPLVIVRTPVYVELPVVHNEPSVAARARLVLLDEGEAPAGAYWDLDRVEDLGLVAAVNQQAQLPLIYTRSLLRAGAKSVAATLVANNVRETRGSGTAAAVAWLGLLLLVTTERADLRCWETLPGEAYVRIAHLPPGEHRVRMEFLDENDDVIDIGPVRTINVPESGLETMIEYYPY